MKSLPLAYEVRRFIAIGKVIQEPSLLLRVQCDPEKCANDLNLMIIA